MVTSSDMKDPVIRSLALLYLASVARRPFAPASKWQASSVVFNRIVTAYKVVKFLGLLAIIGVWLYWAFHLQDIFMMRMKIAINGHL